MALRFGRTGPPTGAFTLNRASMQADGLGAWWPILGDGLLLDRGLFGLHGSINTATIQVTERGWAVVNTDTANYASISDVAAPLGQGGLRTGTGSFAISCWIKVPSGTADANCGLVSKGADSTAGFKFRLDPGGSNRWECIMRDASTSVNYLSGLGAGTQLADGVWHHVLANVIRGATDTWVFYHDGKLYGTAANATIAGNAIDSTGDVRIGENADVSIQDVRLYNRILSDAEIWQLYDPATRWELYEPVVRYWQVGAPAAGGTNYEQAAAGSTTPTGALVRKPAKALAGSTTPTGTLVRQAQKVLAGATAPVGALVRSAAKVLAGSTTPTGTLVRQANKVMAGAVGLAGALVRQANKVMAGTLGLSGTLVRSTAKAFTGSTTPTGALLKQAQLVLAGAVSAEGALSTFKVALRSVGGALELSGTLVRDSAKVLVGSITPTGTLVKLTAKAFAGATTPTGALAKRTNKVMAGAVGLAGVLVRRANKVLAGAVGLSGTLARQVRKVLAGALGLVGSLNAFAPNAVRVDVALSDAVVTVVALTNASVTALALADAVVTNVSLADATRS